VKTKKQSGLRITRRRVVVAGIVTVVLYFGFLAEYNFYRLWTLQQKRQYLLEQVRLSEAKNKDLLSKIDRLKHDDSLIEAYARQFGMGRADETVYIVSDQDSE
jgi:cell division protein FtsB